MHWNEEWLSVLGRTSLMLAVSAVLIATALSLFRVRSTTLRRVAWTFVLLQGWMAAQATIVLEREGIPAPFPVATTDLAPAAATVRNIGPAPLDSAAEFAVEGPADIDAARNAAASAPEIAAAAEPLSGTWPVSRSSVLLAGWVAGAVLVLFVGIHRYASFLRLIAVSTGRSSGIVCSCFKSGAVIMKTINREKPRSTMFVTFNSATTPIGRFL
jgi:hypothetical protein